MNRVNSCPRCQGFITLENDLFGWEEVCLNCGFRRPLQTAVWESDNKVLAEEHQPVHFR